MSFPGSKGSFGMPHWPITSLGTNWLPVECATNCSLSVRYIWNLCKKTVQFIYSV